MCDIILINYYGIADTLRDFYMFLIRK